MSSPIQDRVAKIVSVLLAYRGMPAIQLAQRLGMSRQKFSDRMNGRARFTLEEVERMSEILGVGAGVWFDEPESVMAYLATRPGDGDTGGEVSNRWTSPTREYPLANLRDDASLDLTAAAIPHLRVS